MSVPKIILIWIIVTKKWCAHQYLGLSLLFPHFLVQKIQNFWKIKKIPGDIIILHQCTKNDNHMIFNLQNMMWIALQVILGDLCLLPYFWLSKSKSLKKRKKIPGYIIILHLHLKSHNHLMYSSLQMMPTALQVILGQIFALLFHFWSKIKIFEKWKNAWNVLKTVIITKILKLTIISHVFPQIECAPAFCQFWVIFVPLPYF